MLAFSEADGSFMWSYWLRPFSEASSHLGLCEARCLIRPNFIGLLWPLHRQPYLTVCFTRLVEFKLLLCPSEMGKNWLSACLRLVFYKCQQVRHRSDRLKRNLRVLSFYSLNKTPFKVFMKSGMDWYRFWNTLNLKPDTSIAQDRRNPLGATVYWTRWSDWNYPGSFHEN